MELARLIEAANTVCAIMLNEDGCKAEAKRAYDST